MRVVVDAVSKGRRGQALPDTSLAYCTGQARLVAAETEQRPTVLGLIASGRMRPDTGSVTVDGRADASGLRRRIALVDAPDVSDPAPNVTVFTVVSEELMFAGRPAGPLAARAWLQEQGLAALSRVPIADIPPADRLRMLLELTVLRAGVTGLVLVSPDRHGGDPHEWWALAEEFAARDLAVLVIAGEASATVLEERATRAHEPLPDAPASAPAEESL
jgi:pimeloyl-ACP methyl ester carboxylesterase